MAEDYLSSLVKSIQDEDIIEHHGIKGMRWGIRSRRPVGELSPRKQRRLEKKADKKRMRMIRKQSRDSFKNYEKQYATRSSMSTQEMQKAVERLRLENEFKRQLDMGRKAQSSSNSQKTLSTLGKISSTKVPNGNGGLSPLSQVVATKASEAAMQAYANKQKQRS